MSREAGRGSAVRLLLPLHRLVPEVHNRLQLQRQGVQASGLRGACARAVHIGTHSYKRKM